MKPLVLASASPFRRQLLARLRLPFEAVVPPYAEEPDSSVPARDLALRHALGKARSVAPLFPDRVVIGSDQVAELDGRILGKPGTPQAAVEQLTRMAGRRVAFQTGLAVVGGTQEHTGVETYWVNLRPLLRSEIEAYVAAERPLNSAGSFRIEGLGIVLMQSLEGRDYTSLIGLPLIALAELLQRVGIHVLRCATGLRTSDTSS